MHMARVVVGFDDEFGDGALLVIQKRFNSHDTVYEYPVLKVNGLWRVPGVTGPLNTTEFLTWICQGMDINNPPRIFWAPTLEELV
jgi:hypothetical protein